MSHHGIGNLVRIDERLNSNIYCDILQDHLASSITYYGGIFDNYIFQQDNDPKHTSATTRNWLESNRIQTLDWPPQSPDLNPIENLWAHLKRRLESFDSPPESMYDLWSRMEAEWNKITKGNLHQSNTQHAKKNEGYH